MWAALVRGAPSSRRGPPGRDHRGAHRQRRPPQLVTPFPDWVPLDVVAAARALDPATARAQLGPWADAPAPRMARKPSGAAARKPRRRA